MADLSGLVEYNKTHTVELVNPATYEAVGVTFNVVSMDSARVVSALRAVQSDAWSKMSRGEDVDMSAAEAARTSAIFVSCVESWDWGDQEFAHISGAGVASEDDKKFIAGHQNASWIVSQIVTHAANLENFMQK